MARSRCLALFAFALALSSGPSMAAEETLVRVITFPTARSLPFYAGLAKGFFAKHGIKADIQFTPNSNVLRDGLADGKFDVAQAALDNAVAMVEAAKKDVAIVMGGDSGTLEFFVQPHIQSFADLRGTPPMPCLPR
jgi:ABC-type nitrate/sulfonate/bicarbonate transport system substrate-binding protein